MNEEDFEAR